MSRRSRVLLGAAIALLVPAGSATAATITVTTTADDPTPGDHQCSLRKAIEAVDAPGAASGDCAPAAFGPNTIVLGPNTYYADQ